MYLFLCHHHTGLITIAKIREHDGSRFVLLSQDCFDNLRSFVVQKYFRIIYSISEKNAIRILIESALNLYTAVGSTDIFTILTLSISEHGTSFFAFICVFFNFFHQGFQSMGLLPPWLNLFSDILFFLKQF